MSPALLRSLLFIAFLVSGATGLVYEVLWSKYLLLLVGSTSFTHTVVLSTFMAGLALGNSLFGRLADRGRNPLRLYALLEIGIGLLCLLFPTLFEALGGFYIALGRHTGPGSASNAVLKITLAALAMLGPCVLMGGTLPVLSKYVVRSLSALGARLGLLYFLNTAGAVVGCLAGGFYVVEHAGLEWGMVATSLVNTAIGGVFYLLAGRADPAPESAAPTEGSSEASAETYTEAQARLALLAIGLAGALTMLYELAFIRILVLSMGGTVHSFSTVLTGFVFGIAAGSAAAGLLLRQGRPALLSFALCELGIGLYVLLSLGLYERLPFTFYGIGLLLAHTPRAYPVFLAAQAGFAILIMVVPAALMGAALPFAARVCVDRLDRLGRRVGGVFSVNTVGSVIGSALTGFVLLPRLGLEGLLLLGAAVSGGLGLVLLRGGRSKGASPAEGPLGPRWALWMAGVFGVLLAVQLARHPTWDPRLMQFALYRWERPFDLPDWEAFRAQRAGEKFIYARDDADASIAVGERDQERVLRVNGKPDATNGGDLATQLMVAHVPMMLHPDPRKVMVVGLGSGATAGAVLRYEGATAEVAEVSREVVRAAAFFEGVNDQVLQNPRMSLTVVDAREYLLLSDEAYDVIVSEPTNVWVPGVAALFTREFYDLAKTKLRPRGLFAQWLQLYSSQPGLVASVAVSLQQSFPYVSAWMISDGDLMFLAGQERPAFDPGKFAARLARVQPGRGMPPFPTVTALDDPILFLAAQIATADGSRSYWPPKSAGPYHDLFPRLEFAAARAQFAGQPFVVWQHLDERQAPRGAEPLFLAEYLAARPPSPEDRKRLAAHFALSSFNARLGGALDLDRALRAGNGDAEAWSRVSEGARARVFWAERLAARALEKPADPAACAAWVDAEAAIRAEASSIFGPGPDVGLRRSVDACVKAHPAMADDLRRRAALDPAAPTRN
jgi:spermidine synthase/MFS family permease